MRTEKDFSGKILLPLCDENKLAHMKDKFIWKHFGYNNLKEIGKLTNEYIKNILKNIHFIRK